MAWRWRVNPESLIDGQCDIEARIIKSQINSSSSVFELGIANESDHPFGQPKNQKHRRRCGSVLHALKIKSCLRIAQKRSHRMFLN